MAFGDVFFGSNPSVPTNTVTTILDFTNTTGGDIVLSAIGGESSTRSEWFVLIDNVLKIKRRNTTASINVDINLHSLKLANSGNIKVNVEHFITGNQEFSAELRFVNG